MDQLIISPSPHIHSGDSVERNMYAVLLSPPASYRWRPLGSEP